MPIRTHFCAGLNPGTFPLSYVAIFVDSFIAACDLKVNINGHRKGRYFLCFTIELTSDCDISQGFISVCYFISVDFC